MPIIEVYVDSSELECDGDCDAAEDLRAAITTAISRMRANDSRGSLAALLKACPDEHSKSEARKEAEIKSLYDKWMAEPEPRPEFLTFAHSLRKHSRT